MLGKVELKLSMKWIFYCVSMYYNKININVYILKDFIKMLKSVIFLIIKCYIWYLVRGNIVL